MEFILYLLIIAIVALQIRVALQTRKKTEEQRDVFENDSTKYKVEKFYIPKIKVSKITYEEIDKNRVEYRSPTDSYKEIEKEYVDPDTGEIEKYKERIVTCKKEDKVCVNLVQINPSNSVAEEIQRVINNYLLRNRGAASDYSLIKDIVERNCTTLEEEIETQTPWPLYFGLMGTMAGIIIGIGGIAVTVGFSAFVQHPDEHLGGLMRDVAAAMVASFCGIGCTTFLSHVAKESKKVIEQKKNSFYSWFQAELMPIITQENASTELKRLEENLSKFNKSFSQNVKELNSTFTLVKSTSQDQAALMKTLEHMDLAKMAAANVTIIREFNETVSKMDDCNSYFEYAKKALQDLKRRNDAVQEATIAVDTNLDKVFSELKDSVDKQVVALQQSLSQSGLAMDKLVADEQKLFGQRSNEIASFYATMQNLKPIIEGLNDWKKELQKQTQEMRTLAMTISRMPVSNGNGTVVIPEPHKQNNNTLIAGVIAVVLVIIMACNMIFTIRMSSTLSDMKDNASQSADYSMPVDTAMSDTVGY